MQFDVAYFFLNFPSFASMVEVKKVFFENAFCSN